MTVILIKAFLTCLWIILMFVFPGKLTISPDVEAFLFKDEGSLSYNLKMLFIGLPIVLSSVGVLILPLFIIWMW